MLPFFEFEVSLDRHNGPVWLNLKGLEGVKDFIPQELGLR